jgi:hypothetical protein
MENLEPMRGITCGAYFAELNPCYQVRGLCWVISMNVCGKRNTGQGEEGVRDKCQISEKRYLFVISMIWGIKEGHGRMIINKMASTM